MKIELGNFNFIRELEKLGLEHQILFAASICERTLPVYVSIDFEENFNHKTLPVLRETLDYIWNFPASGIFDSERLQSFLTTCQKITSEIEDDELCNSPENTAPYVVSYTLELCLTGNIRQLKNVAIGGHGILSQILDFLMQEEEDIVGGCPWSGKSNKEQFEIIKNNYYTKREMQKETNDLGILTNIATINTEFIQKFRHEASPNGCGIIEFE
jgi:Protein of unknown function (DUF416)